MFEKMYGPYLNRGRFLVHLFQLDGIKQYRTFPTEDEARSFMLANQRRVLSSPVTIKAAVEEYVEQRQDLRQSSRITQRFRLEALIRGRETVLVQMFPALMAWEHLVKVNAVDTLHGVRSAANGFFSWCISKRYLKKNPLEGVEIVGAKKCGKEQLRLDEARSFLERAIAVLDGQSLDGRGGSQQRVAVVGAATALLLGARNGEIVSRTVRDLDEEGSVFWIPEAKTKAGIRRVLVPEPLRPYWSHWPPGDRRRPSSSRASRRTGSATGPRNSARRWACRASPFTGSGERMRPPACVHTRIPRRWPLPWVTTASP